MTCGPTWVAIDAVRVISNISTGELGHIIASDLAKEGARTTLLEGPVTHHALLKKVKVLKFYYFDELFPLLVKELKKGYDIVIHLAAVADYQVKKSFKSKLDSSLRNLTLNLTPTRKIIEVIKTLSPETFLVGFKLEDRTLENGLRKKALRLIEKAGCDLVVANGATRQGYIAYVLDQEGKILSRDKKKEGLSKHLIQWLKQRT